MDVDGIVKACLAIADDEGIGKVTMRRLSHELGVTPMAIYHHVASKDELLDLVLDESMRVVEPVDPHGTPLDELVRWGQAFHRLLVDHPSLAHEMAARRLEGPVALGAARRVLELLTRAGVEDDRADELLVALFGFVLGSALYRNSRMEESKRRGKRALPDVDGDPRTGLRDRLAAASMTDDRFAGGLAVLIRGYLV
ncbi:TetR/AcrR family transcriptional regulator [Gordonia westfalica]|uniref:TetR/AcrR family transcriptional regulator n=1 Tax=Gordonia westfalica TaxID=158898 RepID=A0ABU2GVT5_9ACTN|nr:TetR/AcrR family transcriptional regulator [Gordonia westfalica]MDS1114824.1 TetR/AcrR family transcriptional regulator [Gordonia westfalica]